MPDASLYDLDFPTWADQQADLLARLARGERVNAQVDWPHVIEEVQDLGRSDIQAVESLLTRALEHLLKIIAFPSGPVDHWEAEALTFLLDARRRWAPSMGQRIDLHDLYADARQLVSTLTIDGARPRPLPESCRVVVNDLIVKRPEAPDVRRVIGKLLDQS